MKYYAIGIENNLSMYKSVSEESEINRCLLYI